MLNMKIVIYKNIIYTLFSAVLIFRVWHSYYELTFILSLNSNGKLLFVPTLKTETIYMHEFGDAEDFYVFNYNDKEIKEVLKKNDFEKIADDNVNDARKVLTKYRDDLCERELSLFDKSTSISELSKIGNYYLYLELNEKDYFVCIINFKDNKLNVFYINH